MYEEQSISQNMRNISLKLENSDFASTKITRSQDAEAAIRKFYGDDLELFESFFLLLLNNANMTTGYVKISQGGCAGTVVDPKIIAKYAIDTLSAGVILAHNHPSGDTRPSEADKIITAKIKAGLQLFDIKVLDHIILTATGYLSFMDDGIM